MVTLTDLKAYLGITVSTYDTLLTSFIGYISSEIEAYVGRPIRQTTVSGEVLRYQYTRFDSMPNASFGLNVDRPKAFTEYYPVSSLTVYDDTTALVDGTDYDYNADNGTIEFYTYASDDKENLTANYTAGYAYTISASSVPKDLQLVAMQGIKELFEQSGTAIQSSNAQTITHKTVGDYSVTYDSSVKKTTKDYLDSNKIILNRYLSINL